MNKLQFASIFTLLIIFSGFGLAATRTHNVQLVVNAAPAGIYESEFPATSGSKISGDAMISLGLELADIGFTLRHGPHTFVIKKTSEPSFYQYIPKNSVYLCSTGYTDPRVTTDLCLREGTDFVDSIVLEDIDKEKYTITLDNYTSGKQTEVYLNGKKIISSFKLSDAFNEVQVGCFETAKKHRVCLLIEGDEQDDFSIDIHSIWITVNPPKTPALPPAPVVVVSSKFTSLAEAGAKLGKKLADQVFTTDAPKTTIPITPKAGTLSAPSVPLLPPATPAVPSVAPAVPSAVPAVPPATPAVPSAIPAAPPAGTPVPLTATVSFDKDVISNMLYNEYNRVRRDARVSPVESIPYSDPQAAKSDSMNFTFSLTSKEQCGNEEIEIRKNEDVVNCLIKRIEGTPGLEILNDPAFDKVAINVEITANQAIVYSYFVEKSAVAVPSLPAAAPATVPSTLPVIDTLRVKNGILQKINAYSKTSKGPILNTHAKLEARAQDWAVWDAEENVLHNNYRDGTGRFDFIFGSFVLPSFTVDQAGSDYYYFDVTASTTENSLLETFQEELNNPASSIRNNILSMKRFDIIGIGIAQTQGKTRVYVQIFFVED